MTMLGFYKTTTCSKCLITCSGISFNSLTWDIYFPYTATHLLQYYPHLAKQITNDHSYNSKVQITVRTTVGKMYTMPKDAQKKWHVLTFVNISEDQSVDVSIMGQWVVCFSSDACNMKYKPRSVQPWSYLWKWHAGFCPRFAKLHC